ncbi:hypothetical protein ACT7C9_24910 [Bacillus cereus]
MLFCKVHKLWTVSRGNANVLRKMAEDLDNLEGWNCECIHENSKEGIEMEVIQQLVDAETG